MVTFIIPWPNLVYKRVDSARYSLFSFGNCSQKMGYIAFSCLWASPFNINPHLVLIYFLFTKRMLDIEIFLTIKLMLIIIYFCWILHVLLYNIGIHLKYHISCHLYPIKMISNNLTFSVIFFLLLVELWKNIFQQVHFYLYPYSSNFLKKILHFALFIFD